MGCPGRIFQRHEIKNLDGNCELAGRHAQITPGGRGYWNLCGISVGCLGAFLMMNRISAQLQGYFAE
jgi:hypothetical protein